MVVFRNVSYFLPAWSVSILPDCKNVAFNTAKVSFNIIVPFQRQMAACYKMRIWPYTLLLRRPHLRLFHIKLSCFIKFYKYKN